MPRQNGIILLFYINQKFLTNKKTMSRVNLATDFNFEALRFPIGPILPGNTLRREGFSGIARGRGLCVTVNNFTDLDWEILKNLDQNRNKYLNFSYETAPTTGTRHIQGYAYWINKKFFDQVRTLLREVLELEPHIEIAKGSAELNRDYILTEGIFAEGQPRGKPKPWKSLKAVIYSS